MRLVLQRVSRASVAVDGAVVGAIGQGLLILVGVADRDSKAQAEALARKVAGLRIFSDAEGRFNESLLDVGGSALVVSQFTLHADVRKGRRPSFTVRRLRSHCVSTSLRLFGERGYRLRRVCLGR